MTFAKKVVLSAMVWAGVIATAIIGGEPIAVSSAGELAAIWPHDRTLHDGVFPAADLITSSPRDGVSAPNVGAMAALTVIPEEAIEIEFGKLSELSQPTILDEVRWTVTEPAKVDTVAMRWGMPLDMLRRLNPQIAGVTTIPGGQKLLVYKKDLTRPAQSIGAPNRGRLRGAVPLPEGAGWQLRNCRPRTWGTQVTVEALLESMERYVVAHPDAPPLRIGELSRRTGGRVAPHVSHRTGRDVDIGYVVKPEFQRSDSYWQRVDERNLDAVRTWALVKSLLDTGKVQDIFMSSSVQRIVAREAAKELSEDEIGELFGVYNRDHTRRTLISHQHGHRDHLHVRFVCSPGNRRCQARSVGADI